VGARAPPALAPHGSAHRRTLRDVARPDHGLHGHGLLRPRRLLRPGRLRERPRPAALRPARPHRAARRSAAGGRGRRAGRLVLDARHRHLLRDADAGLRPVPLHGGLQVARPHRGLGRHRGRAEDAALLGRAQPRLAASVLLPGDRLRRALALRLSRRRPFAVRARAAGDPRERAPVHEPGARPAPVQARRLRHRRGVRRPGRRAGRAVPRLRLAGGDVLGLLRPGAHDGGHGRDRHARRADPRRDALHPHPGGALELHGALDDLHGARVRPDGDLPAGRGGGHGAAARGPRVTPLLETRGLGRAFGALQAVAGVSLAVQPLELRAVIGPNGAGKTTLFHLISGLLPPTSGRVLFRGDDFTALAAPARCRRGISRTFQITSIFPELSVLENVRVAVQLKAGDNFRLLGGRAILEATEQRARDSLRLLGLVDRAEELASTLPHGDQRLLEIAMAVAQEPALLLLDEPTQGLSPEDTAATVAVIRQVARERKLTIILVEHDMDVVFDLADRISVLHFGQLIAEGTAAEIRANAEVQKAYLGGLD